MRSGGRPDCAMAAVAAAVPRSVAFRSRSAPPNAPKAVRFAARNQTSWPPAIRCFSGLPLLPGARAGAGLGRLALGRARQGRLPRLGHGAEPHLGLELGEGHVRAAARRALELLELLLQGVAGEL